MRIWQILILAIILGFAVLLLPAQGAVIEEAYVSFSVRTAKQSESELLDYEWKAGVSFPDWIKRIDALYERENDMYYTGFYAKTYQSRSKTILLRDFSAEFEMKQAYARNELWVYKGLLGLGKNTDIRMSGRWSHGIFDGVYLGISSKWQLWQNIYYEMSFDTDFSGSPVSRHNVVARYDIGKLYQQLRVIRHIGSGQDSFQVKTELGIKL